MEFYNQTGAEVVRAQRSSARGLSGNEAKKRLTQDGPNILKVRGKPWWQKVLEPFLDTMVLVLLMAALIGWWQREYLDTIIILVIIFFNAIIDWAQQYSTARILRALKRKEAASVLVYRDGKPVGVGSETLVRGDILLLQEGQKIPADARLLEVNHLACDESLLTGESSSVSKTIAVLTGKKEVYQRRNFVFSGAYVTTGTGMAVVTATGNHTVFGKLAQLAVGDSTLVSPMKAKVEKLITWIVGVVFALAGLMFAIEVWRGIAWPEALRLVIALAVSAVPEGLPIAMTVVMALGMYQLAKKKALVRNLRALENIGLVTTIATDKTGTLTKNQLRVQEVWSLGASQQVLARQVKLAINQSQGVSSDPLDIALNLWVRKFHLPLNLTKNFRLALPFNFQYALSGNIYHQDKQDWAYLKGAPEKVLHRCRLGKLEAATIDEHFKVMASQGYRVLALARIKVDSSVKKLSHLPTHNWQLLGLLAVADELRPEATGAIARAKRAGVDIKMITGDHQLTAWQIGRKIGIATSEDAVCNARELAHLSPTKQRQFIERGQVFARVLPEVKYDLINTLNKKEITAMTGDGVNDVAAMSRAHVGIAMGSGAQITKEAADIVLLDDNFRTIVTALKQGRIIVANIRRMLVYLLATNAGEIGVTLGALLLRLPLPLQAVQILWINLVTDTLMVIPLGLESGEKHIMKQPPEDPRAPILSKFLISRIVLAFSVMSGVCLGVYYYYLGHLPQEQAMTLVFWALVVMQLANALGMRSDLEPTWRYVQRHKHWVFWGAMVVAIILQLLLLVSPLGEVLHLVLPASQDLWLVTILSVIAPLAALELHKWWGRRELRA